MNLTYTFLLSCLLCSVIAFAKRPVNEVIEQDLLSSYRRILDFKFNGAISNWDSLEAENSRFLKKMLGYTGKYGSTLNYSFDSLQSAGVNVVTAEDGVLRIYSWDTWTGGTAHVFYSVFQYASFGEVYSTCFCDTALPEKDMGNSYFEVYTLKADSHTYYMALSDGIYSTKDVTQFITAYNIEGNKLIHAPIFSDDMGVFDGLAVSFDFFNVVDRPERPVRMIRYEKETERLFVPVIVGDFDNNEVVSYNQFNVHQFRGKYFEPVKCLADVSTGDTTNWYTSGEGEEYVYYCEEPVYVYGDVFYSIITTDNRDRVSSNVSLVTFNVLTWQLLDSVFLYTTGDIDQSMRSYDWYEHEYDNDNGVRVIRQKVNRKANEPYDGERENSEVVEFVTWYTVDKAGKIGSNTKR